MQTNTDQSQLESLAMIGDAYRVLAVLSKHPRIDGSKIALMGFSKGGNVALHASMKRFQRMYGSPGVVRAFVPFYAPCNTTYLEETIEIQARVVNGLHRLDNASGQNAA